MMLEGEILSPRLLLQYMYHHFIVFLFFSPLVIETYNVTLSPTSTNIIFY